MFVLITVVMLSNICLGELPLKLLAASIVIEKPYLGGIFSLHLSSIKFKSGLLTDMLLASVALNLIDENSTPTPEAKS